MLTLDELSRRPEPCRRCGSRFKVALPRRSSELEQLAGLSSQGYKMELIRVLRALTGCSLADAKGTVQHLAPKPGTCHRCSRSIPTELLISDCQFCGSLNLQLDLTFPCPVCGFLVLSEAYGCFDICPVCGWEDDGLQLANPTSRGGANSESLTEAQAAALQEHPLSQAEADGFTRSTLWRPLSPEEIERFEEKEGRALACSGSAGARRGLLDAGVVGGRFILEGMKEAAMPIVKTAISLPEPLFERVDAFARQQNISRSQLFARAVEEFLRRHESQALLEAINRAYDDFPTPEEKKLLRSMAQKQRALVKGEW